MESTTPTGTVGLRDVCDDDLPIFFAQQLDAEASRMAAFTRPDPHDRVAFDAHWARIRTSPRVAVRTVLFDGQVAGHVAGFEEDGERQVCYWIGKPYWGRGIATRALRAFLGTQHFRPLHARVAKDNLASIRVLEQCGFTITGEDRGYAHARGEEVDEFVMTLGSEPDGAGRP